MTVKPIDMQVNINQMTEVARNEHVRSVAAAEAQHVIEKESKDRGKEVPSRLEENKKAEKTMIKKDDFGRGRQRGKRERGKGEHGAKTEVIEDETIGRLIDVKK